MRKIEIIFLSISLYMCFGWSKEPSHWESSFEYPQHMFWLRNKKNNFQLGTLIWGLDEAEHLPVTPSGRLSNQSPISSQPLQKTKPLPTPLKKSFISSQSVISMKPTSNWGKKSVSTNHQKAQEKNEICSTHTPLQNTICCFIYVIQ